MIAIAFGNGELNKEIIEGKGGRVPVLGVDIFIVLLYDVSIIHWIHLYSYAFSLLCSNAVKKKGDSYTSEGGKGTRFRRVLVFYCPIINCCIKEPFFFFFYHFLVYNLWVICFSQLQVWYLLKGFRLMHCSRVGC